MAWLSVFRGVTRFTPYCVRVTRYTTRNTHIYVHMCDRKTALCMSECPPDIWSFFEHLSMPPKLHPTSAHTDTHPNSQSEGATRVLKRVDTCGSVYKAVHLLHIPQFPRDTTQHTTHNTCAREWSHNTENSNIVKTSFHRIFTASLLP